MSTPQHVLVTGPQLGQVLQAARKARRMSQATLATRIGLSQSRVSHLELNAQDLSVAQLLAWSSALDLELSLGPRAGKPQSGTKADW